ncbi:hypothetical protein NP945_31010 [Mesorhizobium sp. LMG17149]|uniref:hypothetical protein n=1 Tax=Mesorhizobium sp. LMG17149 TaxID=2968497 RepID=UPI00211870FC|nr:hypothetical protein [Mesorhizobium sp. LMG17149]MCQ8876278.1 hypothetical protein [Mesorhizobium sp. LMG17149]
MDSIRDGRQFAEWIERAFGDNLQDHACAGQPCKRGVAFEFILAVSEPEIDLADHPLRSHSS